MGETSRREPGKLRAAVLAVLVHLLFLALLVLGVSWRARQPEGMTVDLWSPAPQPAPEAKPAPPLAPSAPQPEPKPQPKPMPKPMPKPEPKPDIALKEKKLKEEQRKREEEKKRLEEAKKREQELKKLAEEKARQEALKEQLAKDAQALQAREQQQEAQRLAQARQAAASAQIVAEYTDRIRAKIRQYVVVPPGVPSDAKARFDVVLLPSGEVLGKPVLIKSSGFPAYDQAVERAILKAQPLPLPPDPALFGQFRNLDLEFRPHE